MRVDAAKYGKINSLTVGRKSGGAAGRIAGRARPLAKNRGGQGLLGHSATCTPPGDRDTETFGLGNLIDMAHLPNLPPSFD